MTWKVEAATMLAATTGGWWAGLSDTWKSLTVIAVAAMVGAAGMGVFVSWKGLPNVATENRHAIRAVMHDSFPAIRSELTDSIRVSEARQQGSISTIQADIKAIREGFEWLICNEVARRQERDPRRCDMPRFLEGT